jgi:hypothetical protein
MTPGADDVTAFRAHGRGQTPEPLLPLVAPDLEIDVDHVVVRDGETRDLVEDRERPRLVGGTEPPDDADPIAEVENADRAGSPTRLEVRRGAREVRVPALGYPDPRDTLAGAVGDLAVAVRELESASEGDGDVLVYDDGAIRPDADTDVRFDEVVRLREGRRGDRESESRREKGDR